MTLIRCVAGWNLMNRIPNMATRNQTAVTKTATVRRAPSDRDFPRPYTTVDLVIFTVRSDALEVLLVQRPEDTTEPFPGMWALPGGFVCVDLDSDLPACARRKLQEKTGVARAPTLNSSAVGAARRGIRADGRQRTPTSP